MRKRIEDIKQLRVCTDIRAYEMLTSYAEQKRKPSKVEKKEILQLLADCGIPLGLFTLAGFAMDAVTTPKTGRARDLFKRDLIRNYWVEKGFIPQIRAGKSGHRKNTDPARDAIARCADEIKRQIVAIMPLVEKTGKRIVPVPNARNLITKLLKDFCFRKEVDELIELKRQSKTSIPKTFTFYLSSEPRNNPLRPNDIK